MGKSSVSIIDKIIITLVSLLVPAIATFLLVRYLDGHNYNYNDFQGINVSNTLLGVWSTLLGFMITSVSILIAIGGNQYIEIFRGSKHYHTVMYSHVLTCMILFVATIYSVAITCLNVWEKIYFCGLMFLLFSSFIALGFSIYFLFFIIFKSQ